jgi:hypothetical protein
MEAANQLRAKCNALSDEKRSALLQRGLDVIYGYGRNTPLPPLAAVDTNMLTELGADCAANPQRDYPRQGLLGHSSYRHADGD